MKVYSVDSLKKYLELIDNIQKIENNELWFRGQSEANWHLSPSIFRPPWIKTTHDAKGNKLEKNAISISSGSTVEVLNYSEMKEQFINEIKLSNFNTNLPTNDVGWMTLMQHHGIPTPLLDWTSDKNVALYFSLPSLEKLLNLKDKKKEQDDTNLIDTDFPEDHGSVWILNPAKVNKITCGVNGFLTLGDDDFFSSQDFPICFSPPSIHERVILQKSKFTIHGNLTHAINYYNEINATLYKINIPYKCMVDLKLELHKNKMGASTFFDGIDSIAVAVTEKAMLDYYKKFDDSI